MAGILTQAGCCCGDICIECTNKSPEQWSVVITGLTSCGVGCIQNDAGTSISDYTFAGLNATHILTRRTGIDECSWNKTNIGSWSFDYYPGSGDCSTAPVDSNGTFSISLTTYPGGFWDLFIFDNFGFQSRIFYQLYQHPNPGECQTLPDFDTNAYACGVQQGVLTENGKAVITKV